MVSFFLADKKRRREGGRHRLQNLSDSFFPLQGNSFSPFPSPPSPDDDSVSEYVLFSYREGLKRRNSPASDKINIHFRKRLLLQRD